MSSSFPPATAIGRCGDDGEPESPPPHPPDEKPTAPVKEPRPPGPEVEDPEPQPPERVRHERLTLSFSEPVTSWKETSEKP